MNDVKGLLTSKTVWGVIVMLVGTLLGMSQEAQAATTADVMVIVQAVVQIIGAAMAIYGRVMASKRIQGLV